MHITFDPLKRQKTLDERGLDFADAPLVFAGEVFEFEDIRQDYGERRMICYGTLQGRLIMIGCVQRHKTRHVFSMRKANEREKEKFGL